MSQSRRMFPTGGLTRAAGLEFAATLPPLWGFPKDTDITPAEVQGVNNLTFLVRYRQRRYVLRVTGFLSMAEVRAEHRIMGRLMRADLPFQVPEPVAALDGQTVMETPAGPATLCRWLPGVRPGTDGGMTFERLGRAVGVIDAALADVPMGDALRDWRTDPRWVRPDDPPVDVLVDELCSAGISGEQAGVLTAAARRAGRWWPHTDGLPAQVIHGDITPANLLADRDTGEVTGLLDFELAGAGFRVQDVLAALYHSTALSAPDWPRRTAAFLRGRATVSRLEPAEVAALPELLIAHSLGSVLWGAVRWRAGLSYFGDVTGRIDRLEASTRWLAANEDKLLSVAAAANVRSLGHDRSTRPSAVRGRKLLGDLPDVAARVGEGRRPHAPVPVGRTGQRAHAASGDLRAHRVHVIDDDRELPRALPRLLKDFRQRLGRRSRPVQEHEDALEPEHRRVFLQNLGVQAERVRVELPCLVEVGDVQRDRPDLPLPITHMPPPSVDLRRA